MSNPASIVGSSSSTEERIPALDGFRAIAFMMVFANHAFGVPLLWMGVDLFFVLSGFLITGILLRRKESGASYFEYFYGRRALRILAPYCLLLSISSAAFGLAWAKHWQWYAFFLPNVGWALDQGGHESLGLLWSLGVEEQFYFVWPLVVFYLSESTLLRISVALLVMVPALRAVCTSLFSTHFPIYYLTIFRMDTFAAGAALAIMRKRGIQVNSSPWISYASCAGGVVLLFAAAAWGHWTTGSNRPVSNALLYSIVLLIAASFLALALYPQSVIVRVLRLSPMRFLGTISYSLYLIHATALLLCRQWFGGGASAAGAALVLAIAYATVIWFVLEKPLLSIRLPRWDRHTLAPAVVKAGVAT